MSAGEGAALAALAVLLAVNAGVALSRWPSLRALMWSGRMPGRLGALPVERVEHHRAPRGWKCAHLVIDPRWARPRLAGVVLGDAYGVEARAGCARGKGHRSPSLTCECGFHAFRERPAAARLVATRVGFGEHVISALCEVDLTGRVIEHDRGYRGEYQRVLGVALLPWCVDCASRGDLVRAERIAGEPDAHRPLVAHGSLIGVGGGALPASVWRRLSWIYLRPLCGPCADRLPDTAPRLTALATGELIGTEVRWAESDEAAASRLLTERLSAPRR